MFKVVGPKFERYIDTCHNFQTPEYAGWVSSMAGVLAAVTITAIALRLSAPPVGERTARSCIDAAHISANEHDRLARTIREYARPFLTLPVIFFSALLAAYGYSLIAGTTPCEDQTALTIFFGEALAIAIVLTCYTIAQLLLDYDVDSSAVRNANVVCIMAAFLAVNYMWGATTDHFFATERNISRSLETIILLAAAVPFAAGVLARYPFGRWTKVLRSPRSLQYLMIGTVIDLLFIAICASVFSRTGAEARVEAWQCVGALLLCTVVLGSILAALPKAPRRTSAT
jgi:hypothetical protein